jgi:hypothetical protein
MYVCTYVRRDVNNVVCAPVMIGFAAIIFRHPAFHADPAV